MYPYSYYYTIIYSGTFIFLQYQGHNLIIVNPNPNPIFSIYEYYKDHNLTIITSKPMDPLVLINKIKKTLLKGPCENDYSTLKTMWVYSKDKLKFSIHFLIKFQSLQNLESRYFETLKKVNIFFGNLGQICKIFKTSGYCLFELT